MKILFILLCTLISASGVAQVNELRYNTISLDSALYFPVFSNAKNTNAVHSINQFLQFSKLKKLVSNNTSNVFGNIRHIENDMHVGVVDMDFQILSQNDKYLSLKFNGAIAGVTMWYYTSYYNFNMGNGEPIQLTDLFIVDSLPAVRNMILTKRIAKLKSEITKVDTTGFEDEGLNYIGECIINEGVVSYYIANGKIIIDDEACLNKGDKFLGLDMQLVLSPIDYKKYLNEFGLALFGFSNKPIGKFHSTSLPQVFEGTINRRRPMVLLLDQYLDNEVGGWYYLPNQDKIISVEGELNGTTLVLTTKNDEGEETGTIKATFNQKSIIGILTKKGTTEALKIRLKRPTYKK